MTNEPHVDLYGEIARLAYRIWETERRPEGRALDHWLQAETQLKAGGPNPASRPKVSVVAPESGSGERKRTKGLPPAAGGSDSTGNGGRKAGR